MLRKGLTGSDAPQVQSTNFLKPAAQVWRQTFKPRRKGGVGRLAVNAVGQQGFDTPPQILGHAPVGKAADAPPAAVGVLNIYTPADGSPASALCIRHGRPKDSHLPPTFLYAAFGTLLFLPLFTDILVNHVVEDVLGIKEHLLSRTHAFFLFYIFFCPPRPEASSRHRVHDKGSLYLRNLILNVGLRFTHPAIRLRAGRNV